MQYGLSIAAAASILSVVACLYAVISCGLLANTRRATKSRNLSVILCLLLLLGNFEGRSHVERLNYVIEGAAAAPVCRGSEIIAHPWRYLGADIGVTQNRSCVFIHRSQGPNTSCSRRNTLEMIEKNVEGSCEGVDNGTNIAVEEPSAEESKSDRPLISWRAGAKRIRRGSIPKPRTMADIIKYRIISQPPSLKYTRRVLARKPWKRMNIPERIQQEKQKIEETDKYLDKYFYNYLMMKGTDSGFSDGVKHIDATLFKSANATAEKMEGSSNESEHTINQYNMDEIMQIWNTKGGYFYTTIPKTVAMLQIIRRIAKESNADTNMRNNIREHTCFKRIVGSVVRHIKCVTRIELPKHLKNYDKLTRKIPMFSEQQMTTIFTVLAYFGFRNEKVIQALLNHAKPFKNFTPEDMRSIIMACLSMKFDPSPIVEEYIEKLKSAMKDGPEPKMPPGGEMEYYLDVLHICNQTDHMDNWTFTHIADLVKKQEKITLEDAANAVCLFTDVQHLDETLFQHLYDVLTNNIDSIKRKTMVKKLISSLAMSHFKPPKQLVDHLANMLLKEVNAYSLVEVTTAMRNLALMDCYNEDLCRKVFNLGIFVNPPSVKVLQQINLQLNKKKTVYAAYLHPVSSSSLNVVFGNLYQAYLGYRTLAKNKNKMRLPESAEIRLKVLANDGRSLMMQEIYTSGVKNWTFTSSSFHIQVRDLLKEAFDIDCEIEHVTNEGLVIDIAILPSSLSKLTEKLGAKDFLKDKRCAIEVHGPFHYLQKSTDQFPPPLNNTTLFKERILRENGWDVSHLQYWSFVPWMKKEHKIKVLERLLPKWVKNVCKGAAV
ncbi:putative membrane protein [Babesia divergens]|uniref:Membrane protein n=1 Tax=Babesia divergens TaxID=32595 RepID=A0AAD9LFD9_BABDI|nr:putative membrane protein [Babesia divergens]